MLPNSSLRDTEKDGILGAATTRGLAMTDVRLVVMGRQTVEVKVHGDLVSTVVSGLVRNIIKIPGEVRVVSVLLRDVPRISALFMLKQLPPTCVGTSLAIAWLP